MPRADDILNETGGCSWFSRIDLFKSYWHEFPFKKTPSNSLLLWRHFMSSSTTGYCFGWTKTGALFQKNDELSSQSLLGTFLRWLCRWHYRLFPNKSRTHWPSVSSSEALSTARLKINIKKSEFFQNRLVFLGRVFGGKTKKALKRDQCKESQSWRSPTIYIHLLFFFVVVGFGHFPTFIKNYAAKKSTLSH